MTELESVTSKNNEVSTKVASLAEGTSKQAGQLKSEVEALGAVTYGSRKAA